MGLANRKPTPDELDKMRAIVEQGMKDGAFGLSTGLFYVPGAFSSTEEIIELAKVAGRFGGFHESHMRDEAFKVLDSVRETIRIGEEGGLATQVTHHKIIGTKNFGRSVDTLRLIDEARARGVDATIDQYPYTASSNAFEARWCRSGRRRRARADARAPEESVDAQGNRGRDGAHHPRRARRRRPKNCASSRTGISIRDGGKNLADVARCAAWSRPSKPRPKPACGSSSRATARRLPRDERDRISSASCGIRDDDRVRRLGAGARGRRPHPRSYGTFARVLGVYVRERNVITLEDAIRKMTSVSSTAHRVNRSRLSCVLA
jgi:hypothetical protein